jgi:large subunit ribosomal protein L10
MARADKTAAVAELTTSFRESQAAVLTEYRGLRVSDLTALRTALGDNATYSIVKNTLTKIAARDAGLDNLDELLVGPSAIAFVHGDPVEAAKGLRDFARTHPLLVIKGGVLDGAPLSPAELTRLADVEPREVLLAKMAGAMKASLSGAAALFQAPLAKAARTVEALRAKYEADPANAGASDGGASDAGVTDAGTTDTGTADAGSVDADSTGAVDATAAYSTSADDDSDPTSADVPANTGSESVDAAPGADSETEAATRPE